MSVGIWDHWCKHPGYEKWGCFGEPHGKETRWYCGEHSEGWRK
jgi:hypothetical protein